MGLANLAALGFLAIVPVVVALYLLKLKRREVVVSSTLLWRKSLQDTVANAPFQRLRNNLLLYLQLLALLLLVAALARPYFSRISLGEQRRVVLLDTSASMQASDVERGRMHEAIARARELIRAKAPGDAVMLVTFGGQTRIVAAMTTDGKEAERALETVRATDGRADPTEALAIAAEVVKKDPATRVTVISDGAFAGDALAAEALPAVEYIQVGGAGENAGITALEYRANPGAPMEAAVLVRVSNFTSAAAEFVVQLEINGEITDVRSVFIEAGTTGSVVFPLRGAIEGVARLSLLHDDHLPVDNVAYGVLTPPQPRKALLVSKGNYFLERALALRADLTVERVAPGGIIATAGYDFVVFDGAPVPQDYAGAALVFNATAPIRGFVLKPPVVLPSILDWDRGHPIGRYLDFGNVIIRRAYPAELPAWGRGIMETSDGYLIAALEDGSKRVLWVGFDLLESNWPLLYSFPIFLHNGLDWLLDYNASRLPFQHASGDPVLLTSEPGQTVTVTDPDGVAYRVESNANQTAYFAHTMQCGLYTAVRGTETRRFAVNLVSPEESNIASTPMLVLGERRIAAAAEPGLARTDLWRFLALASLGVLAVEWWLYTRRTWL